MANVYERLAKAEQDARNAVYFASENKAITELNILKGNIKDEVWEADHDYTKGDIFRYLDAVYEVVQSHRSQADWTPDITPALYKKTTEEGKIPVWVQPTGAQDAYNTGDKVHYPDADGPVYISTVDSNVWSPDVYGWELAENVEEGDLLTNGPGILTFGEDILDTNTPNILGEEEENEK